MTEEGTEVEAPQKNGDTVSKDTVGASTTEVDAVETCTPLNEASKDADAASEEHHTRLLLSSEECKRRGRVLMEKKRRIMFTDAAVAIALTLLILPLMDAAVESSEVEDITTFEWFQKNKDLLLTFFLSFMVTGMAWADHDRLFRSVSNFSKILSILNFLWLMAIAFLPAATNIMNGVVDDPLNHLVWIGTMLFAKVVTTIMMIVVHRDPDTWSGDGPQYPQFVGSMVSLFLLLVALLVSITPAGYWIMLILILRVPMTRAILWKWPGLKTKWASQQTEASSGNSTSEATATSKDHLKDVIEYLLDIKTRFEGLIEAERRIIFTDAAAAIALTLLVLPLMDAATEARGVDTTTAEWFQENKKLLLSFFLSYLVIILCWNDQDRLFRHVGYFTAFLSVLNFLWLLAIVFIPVATSVMNLVEDDPLQHFMYIGTPLLAKIWTFFMTIEVHRNPGTWEDGGPSFPLLLDSLIFIVFLVIALFLSMTTAGYWILFITILKYPMMWLILKKWPGLETKW